MPELTYAMYTMCLVIDGDRVLLIKRPASRDFPGFIGPGGKIDFPESPAQGAIREVWEETGRATERLSLYGIQLYRHSLRR